MKNRIYTKPSSLTMLPMRKLSGFTLLEVSMVLVIIGFMVAVIATATTVLETARLQKIMADKGLIVSAVNTYKKKYDAIPGDHGAAEDIFGSATTDNGSDNGVIDIPATNNDSWLFWAHLSLADLWVGTFTGDNGPSATNTDSDAVIGSNVPPAPIDGVGYSIYYSPANVNVGNLPRYHFVAVGKDGHTDNKQTLGGWISPAAAYELDAKYDDGVANSGNVRTWVASANHDTTDCTTTAAPNHVYNVTDTDAVCNLLLMFDP